MTALRMMFQRAILALGRTVGVAIEGTRAAASLRRSAVRLRIPGASFLLHSRNRELPVNAPPCDRTHARHFPERQITVNVARVAQHASLRPISLATTAPTQVLDIGSTRFAYRRFGSPSGTPLVFTQHFMGNLDNFDPAISDALAPGREIILFDNAGVGRSTGTAPDTIAGSSTFSTSNRTTPLPRRDCVRGAGGFCRTLGWPREPFLDHLRAGDEISTESAGDLLAAP
jgi:hypothetical protein